VCSSRRAPESVGRRRIWRDRHLIGRGRRNLRPSLAQADGFAQAIEELLFAVIVLSAPAVVELEKVRASALGKHAPFLRDLVECVDG
jgi:hypothetical protein